MNSEGESNLGPARHAQVVPAFAVSTIQRPLASRVGDIRPSELLRWERKADLTESMRDALRQAIVKRNRAKADLLWELPVGVRLTDGWRDLLTSSDCRRIEQLAVTPERPLEGWTLREVKQALHVPLDQTLGLLARLEAIYWEPPLPTQRIGRARPAECPPAEPVTSELHALADEVLQLPWLSKVAARDLRFGFGSEGTLPDWIRQHLRAAAVPGSFQTLLRRLLAADKLTAEDEASDVVRYAAQACLPRLSNGESVQRRVAILLRRYISPEGAGRRLQEVGNEYGVSRERIRQVCDVFTDYLTDAVIATPALDRVLQAAARVAPCEVGELDKQLRRFIGAGAGVESLVAWAQALGRQNLPIQCAQVRTRVRGSPVELTMVQLPNAYSWVEPMIRHVSRDSSMFGCTNVLRVAGHLALKEGIAPGQEAIETALEAATGFRWLDKESGWFTLGDSSGCSAASRVRKIMAVAYDTVGTDEIAAALASDDVMMYRTSTCLGLATPPVHVLRELFVGWPWLKVIQKGRFVAGEVFDRSGVLTDAEQACVAVIAQHDGVACRFELKEVVLGKLGLTDVMLAALLGSSPIFERLEHGLYRIIGRRVGDGAVNAARQRLRERASPASAIPADAGANEFFARVTDASLKNEQYHVPTRFFNRLAGKRYQVIGADNVSLGEARVTQSGALVGLNRLFPGVRSGDQYRVEVLETALRVRHSSPNEPEARGPQENADVSC